MQVKTPTEIASYWQDDVELRIEAGETPILELGASNLPSNDSATMLAMQLWSQQRSDVTKPVLPAGGQGPLWVAALLQPLPVRLKGAPPMPVIQYCGVNLAEYSASVSQIYAANKLTEASTVNRSATEFHVTEFFPGNHPGRSRNMEDIPFIELTREVGPNAGAILSDHADDQPASADPLLDWLAWAALLLSLFLILLAFIL